MTEFGHIGFKIICSLFMARTVYHYVYSEDYMQQMYNLRIQKIRQKSGGAANLE